MANKKKPISDKKLSSRVTYLDKMAKGLISNIDSGYTEREILSEKDAKIQNIINSELDLAKGVSDGHIVDFINSLSNKETEVENNTLNLFTEDVGNLFGYFQELHKNRYIELTDLKFITKFIPAIGEAINTTLDAIVSSDDFADVISRNIVLSNSLTESEKSMVMNEVRNIEKNLGLPKKLKNIVYKNTLVSGNYYIYCVPYNELFAEYSRLLKSGAITNNPLVNKASNSKKDNKKFNLNSATESVENIFTSSAMEVLDIPSLKNELANEDFTQKEVSDIESALSQNLTHITTIKSPILMEAIEGYSSVEMMKQNLTPYINTFGEVGILGEENNKITTPDTEASSISTKFHTTGAYIKYIQPNKIVPIIIYNQTIGYFHVHDTSATQKSNAIKKGMSETNIISASSNLFGSTNLSNDKRNKATQTIIDNITQGVLQNFSDKFINKHADFKALIADCIISNGLINNSFQIQFIPANHMIAFSINENEDGIGQSMLTDSLFPAKMLLSLIVSKLLNYMNNGGNRTIAHVKRGPVDVNNSNHTQRVIRMLQEGNVTFSDLLSTNLSFAKFSRNKHIQIPTAKNGDRLIDFEIQEGQEVSMDTDMEKYLEKLAIIGTGVPSAIMEYTDAVDYAKSLVTANIKFASRVAAFQADLEYSTTILYRALLMASSLEDSIKNKLVHSFEYVLSRPKVLSNANMSDYLSTTQSNIETLVNLLYGTDAEASEFDKIKQEIGVNLASDMLPFVDWDKYKSLIEVARLSVIKDTKIESKDEGTSVSDNDTTLDAAVDDGSEDEDY